MSNASIWSMPLMRAVLSAESTPPAGPDSSSRIGVSAAASPEVKPPLDTMMRSGAPGASVVHAAVEPVADTPRRAAARTRSPRSSTCARTRGSRARCRTRPTPRAAESACGAPRRSAFSCASLTYECSRHTATASTPSALDLVEQPVELGSRERRDHRRRRTSSRSSISTRVRRAHERLRYLEIEVVEVVAPSRAPMSSTSRVPLVTTSPVGAPLRSISVLVTSVVPCTTSVTRAALPLRAATSASAGPP